MHCLCLPESWGCSLNILILLCSLSHTIVSISAWAWVGYGHSSNLKKSDELIRKETDPHKIIVSRSHAGTVTEVANKAFDNNVKVTPAGGAGRQFKEIFYS